MENSVRCYIFLFLIVTSAIGFPMYYFGDKCKNATLRAENKDGACKDIHNDGSATALLVIGFIFSLPLALVIFLLMFYCACLCLSTGCGNNTVNSTDDSSSFVLRTSMRAAKELFEFPSPSECVTCSQKKELQGRRILSLPNKSLVEYFQ